MNYTLSNLLHGFRGSGTTETLISLYTPMIGMKSIESPDKLQIVLFRFREEEGVILLAGT